MEILIAAASSTSACAFARLAPAVASSSTRRAAAAPRGVSSSHPNFSSASRHATNPAGSAPAPTTAATTAGRSSLAFLPPGIRVVAAAAENIGDDASLSFSLHSAEDVSVPVHATPSSSSVSRRRLVAASMTMMTLAGVQAAAAAVVGEGDGEEDEEDDEAAQAALVASMNSVLKAYSGEMSYPLQTAFDGASASSATLMRTSFEVSSLWDVPPVTTLVSESAANGAKSTATWSTIMDPVNGKVVTGAVVTVTKGFAKQKITDLGKPENVSVAKVLGLDALHSGAAKRVAKDGQVYYDWELVASPPSKECPSAVGCMYPQHIYLMSATVRGGDLYVLSVDAFPDNWRTAANSLKRIRGSFDVSPAPVDVGAAVVGEGAGDLQVL